MKLNHKLIKSLSLGIVSLGLLAGVGITTGNSNNAHALTADQLLNDPYVNKDYEEASAKANKEEIKESRANARSAAELAIKNTEDAGFPAKDAYSTLREYPSYDMDIVNSVIREQNRKDAAKAAKNSKLAKHVKKHNKHAIKKHRSKKPSKRIRRHTNKKSTKKTKLSKKQYNKLNKQLKKDKKALKSRRAKHNTKYRKALNKTIKQLQKKMKISK